MRGVGVHDIECRAGYAAENVAVIRNIAVNFLKGVTGLNGKKLGVKNKRLLAGLHDGYLLRVLSVMSCRKWMRWPWVAPFLFGFFRR